MIRTHLLSEMPTELRDEVALHMYSDLIQASPFFRLVWTCGCAVLCCAVLCCAVLCCAVLRCAVLCCAVLCCAVLWCAVLCCAALCCGVLCCAVLCCAVGANSQRMCCIGQFDMSRDSKFVMEIVGNLKPVHAYKGQYLAYFGENVEVVDIAV